VGQKLAGEGTLGLADAVSGDFSFTLYIISRYRLI